MNDLEKRETAPLFIVLNRYNVHGQFGPVLCWPDGEIVPGQRSTSVTVSAGSAVRTVTVEFVIGTGVVDLEEFVHLDVNDHRIVPLIKAARAVLERSVVLEEDPPDCAFRVGELEEAIARFEADTPPVGIVRYADILKRLDFVTELAIDAGIPVGDEIDKAFPPAGAGETDPDRLDS